jgi:hypothetical protein
MYPPRQLVKLISIAEATIVLMCQHLMLFKLAYEGSVDSVESMLEQQYIQAIGRRLTPMTLINLCGFTIDSCSETIGNKYAPKPF